MTPIGGEIILETAKTNTLLPRLLHSSSPPLTLTLPFKAAERTDRPEARGTEKEQHSWYFSKTECSLDHLCHLCIIKSMWCLCRSEMIFTVSFRFSPHFLPDSYYKTNLMTKTDRWAAQTAVNNVDRPKIIIETTTWLYLTIFIRLS